ncbi:MAG: monovalent cation/H(+) antiporter subunit G [Vicinamibacterales bacterium]
MPVSQVLALAALCSGAFFFAAGTVGLLRFPDVYTRLHALTKADNFGLGLMLTGLAISAGSWFVALKLLVIWLLVMFASTTACHLIARAALDLGIPPWRRP